MFVSITLLTALLRWQLKVSQLWLGWSTVFYLIIQYDKLIILLIIINKWIERSLNCWSKIPCGLPTIIKIKVNFHQDLMASMHKDFFQ